VIDNVFVKHNRSHWPDYLRCEARGLALLQQAAAGTAIGIPEVIQVDQATLTLARIDATRCTTAQWQSLGTALATMHAQPQSFYGLDENNYIGLNPQSNSPSDNWGEFFVRQRLAYQIGLIDDRTRRRQFSQRLQNVTARVVGFLAASCAFPSVVHGDLWSGNVLCSAGRVWLIDPAVHWADREVDIAMTEMFGAFPTAFYHAYNARLPLTPDYPRKRAIYNLYHYLNHLNLFGDSYLSGCEQGFVALEGV
jgi:fructosamine-3-kinase